MSEVEEPRHQAPNMKRTVPLKDDFSDELEVLTPTRPYDVVFIIASRGRPDMLTRIVDDLHRYFTPAILAADLTYAVGVYAQDYASDWLDTFDEEHDFPLFLQRCEAIHLTIGNVVQTAVQLIDQQMEKRAGHSLFKAKVVVLLDDDSLFVGDALVNRNITRALKLFIENNYMLFNWRLGSSSTFETLPLIEESYPVMPGKEKMQWVRPDILMNAITHPKFSDLTIGEDAVLSTVAWTADPKLCFSVYGLGTFVHLGLEGHLSPIGFTLTNGLESLPEPPEHFTPQKMMPDIFVPDTHPLHDYYGIRPEVISRMRTHGVNEPKFDLG